MAAKTRTRFPMRIKDVGKDGFLKIYGLIRGRDGGKWNPETRRIEGGRILAYADIHTNIGYTHYHVADGLSGFLKALAYKWQTDGEYGKKDKWME